MKRIIIWAVVLAAIMGTGGFLLGADMASKTYPYGSDIVVPAARIVEREVPGEIRFRDRFIYRYKAPEITATAPGGATLTVNTFCAPTVAVVTRDTSYVPEKTELVRSVVATSSWLPFRDSRLFVSTATSTGDLIGRDYHVPSDFGIGTGDSLLVRHNRFTPALKQTTRALASYAVLRLLEVGVRAILDGNASKNWLQEGY